MTAHFKKPASRYGQVEWTLMCPAESYSIIRSIAAQDGDSINRHDNVLINGRVSYPDELNNHLFQIDIWKSEKQIIGNENPSNFAIGGLTFISTSEGIEEDCFSVHQPIQQSIFEDIVQSLSCNYGNRDIFHEIHLKVIGLLNDWDRKGSLDVTEFKLKSHFMPKQLRNPNL